MGLRVFRTVFNLRFERLLYRCNLLAQHCVRWLHVTSFARIAILDLVLRIKIYPRNGILMMFPMTVIVQFLRNCVIITGFFFIGTSTKRVKWCEESSLPCFVAFLSTRYQSVLKDRLNAERTTPCEKYALSNCKECTPSTQGHLLFHQNVLELLESKPRIVSNPRSSRILSCCFLHEQVEDNASLRNLVLHVFRPLSAVPVIVCPNELFFSDCRSSWS